MSAVRAATSTRRAACSTAAPRDAARDVLDATRRLLASIAAQDLAAYRRLCVSDLTSFEPEARGHCIVGLDFHEYYFGLDKGGLYAGHETLLDARVRLLGEGNLGQQTVITTNTTLTALLAFSGKGPQGAVWECEDCPPLGNTTNGHSIEGIAFVANRLANFSVFGPAVCRSEFLRCSFDGARIAGLYIGWGWINTVSGCWAAGNDLVAMYARPSKAIRRASRRISCITQYPSSEPCEPSQCKYMSCALLSKRD